MSGSALVRAAIAEAAAARERGDPPFGAVVADAGGRILARGSNTVRSAGASTRHAEINAIEAAQQALGRQDLSDLTLASSAEPCPMCAGAIHWARLGRVLYGASIPALARETAGGHRQLPLRCAEVLRHSPCEVHGPLEEPAALALFARRGP